MIGFCVDANSNIGMGHLMRCFCIANELNKRKKDFFFVLSSDADDTFLKEHEYLYFRIKKFGKQGWNSEEIVECILKNDCKCLFIDTYRIEENDILEIKKHTKVVYMDDLYEFDCPADIVINHNIEATVEKYYPSKYTDRNLYVGVEYFPLREEFILETNKPLQKNVKEVLITTGGTDPYHISVKIMDILSVFYSEINFNILIGVFYDEAYKKQIKNISIERENVQVISWGQNMAKIYKNSDLVIAPGSTTIYEALSMAVPCISFEFVDNHHMQCIAMDELNIVPFIDKLNNIDSIKEKRIKEIFAEELSFQVRKEQHDKCRRYFDKKGTKRIADILMED